MIKFLDVGYLINCGHRELAEELRVGHATVDEVICLTDSKCNNFESANRMFGTATPEETFSSTYGKVRSMQCGLSKL